MDIRKSVCYTDRVDIYIPNNLTANANNLSSYSYPSTPTYSNVKCRIQPKPESMTPLVIGRSGADQIDTTDIIHVEMDQVILPNSAIQLKTLGHPERLGWWLVQGDPRTQGWRAKKKAAYLKRSLKPPGVA